MRKVNLCTLVKIFPAQQNVLKLLNLYLTRLPTEIQRQGHNLQYKLCLYNVWQFILVCWFLFNCIQES